MNGITVMGGGIFGLSIAYECARRGAGVRLIERARIGAGASGGLLGALSPHAPDPWNAKKAFQLDSLLMAAEFWAGVATLSGVDPGYARNGRLQPLADERAVAQALARSDDARRNWRGQASWQVVGGPDDWRGTSPTGLWVADDLSARLSPRRACNALVAAVRALGSTVIEGGPDAEDAGQATGRVVWATGAEGLADLSADRGYSAGTGVKGQAALFACDARGRPQLFLDGLHVVPHADGTVAVGSTSERTWDDPCATDDRLEELIDRARRLVPALRDAPVTERWAGVRPRAASRAPLLGPWPGREGHFVANGGFKIGFGIAPKVARVMADLLLDGHDAIPQGMRTEGTVPEGRSHPG